MGSVARVHTCQCAPTIDRDKNWQWNWQEIDKKRKRENGKEKNGEKGKKTSP